MTTQSVKRVKTTKKKQYYSRSLLLNLFSSVLHRDTPPSFLSFCSTFCLYLIPLIIVCVSLRPLTFSYQNLIILHLPVSSCLLTTFVDNMTTPSVVQIFHQNLELKDKENLYVYGRKCNYDVKANAVKQEVPKSTKQIEFKLTSLWLVKWHLLKKMSMKKMWLNLDFRILQFNNFREPVTKLQHWCHCSATRGCYIGLQVVTLLDRWGERVGERHKYPAHCITALIILCQASFSEVEFKVHVTLFCRCAWWWFYKMVRKQSARDLLMTSWCWQ